MSTILSYEKTLIDKYYNLKKPTPKEWAFWYYITNAKLKDMSVRYDADMRFATALCAVYSINQKWSVNLRLTEDYLETRTLKGLPLVKEKIKKLESCSLDDDCISDILNGLKIKNFYFNILYPSSADYVTIDRHAAAIAGHQKRINKKAYYEIAYAYRSAADKVKLLPNQLQALLWCNHLNK